MINLARIREKRGVTQEQLGNAVGVSRFSIIEYEKGRISPTLAIVQKLAAFFNVSIDCLLNGPATDGGGTGGMIEAGLRAWKESREAAEAMKPEILADGVSYEEAAVIDAEAAEAIRSLEILRERLRGILSAA